MRTIESIKEFVGGLSDNDYYLISYRYTIKNDLKKNIKELIINHINNKQKTSILCRLVELSLILDKIVYDVTFFEILPLNSKGIEFQTLTFPYLEIELINKKQLFERLLPTIKSKESNHFKIISLP